MRLIKAVEVGYFRSIYKQQLDKLPDMVVLFGRNDSGKSNFLRALNLFFNNETNPGQLFDFFRDFNHGRLDECGERADTRKFTYVKVTFNTPKNWRRSLGDNFWVKKTWSVSRGYEYILENSLSSKRQQFLTRFLNKVQFHYIPAIKDRTIFENLFGQVYEVISGHESFYESLNDFSDELRDKTADISSGLLKELGINSTIAPPSDLTDLFRSLDFETLNEFGDSYSLTLQKGDGIQVRHIPAILGFLSDKSKKDFHIWGFEEPENSLEMANAVAEADAFLNYSESSNKQIFITSHSPAFFSINSDLVKRYFVSRYKKDGLNKEVSRANLLSDKDLPSELMDETPLLPVISEYLKDAHKKILDLKESSKELAVELVKFSVPVVFVEGESDKLVLQRAWQIYGDPDIDIRIESCSGTTKMESLSKDGQVLTALNPRVKVFVVVDNDKEGRELSRFEGKRLGDGGCWIQQKSNKSTWCRLKFTSEFVSKMSDWNIPKQSWPLTIENCFSIDLHKEAVEKGVLSFDDIPHDELIACDKSKKIAIPRSSDINYSYLRAPHPDYKVTFAEWVVSESENGRDILEPFKEVIEGLVENLREDGY